MQNLTISEGWFVKDKSCKHTSLKEISFEGAGDFKICKFCNDCNKIQVKDGARYIWVLPVSQN